MLLHPVLKAYPKCHSWIITAHISLGGLNRQLHMFNHQKTFGHQLLVKLQGQLLASQLVLSALLGEFSNIDSIYESYRPTIWSAVQLLKTDTENMSPPENPWSKGSLLPSWGSTKMANRHGCHKIYTGNQTTCKPSNTVDQMKGDSSPCHIYPKCHKICSSSK